MTTSSDIPAESADRDASAPMLADASRNPFVHGLRGILAFAVVVFHVANSGLPTFHGRIADAANFVLLSLDHSVEIFFGISGIVIYHAFLKSRGPLQFLSNRLTRIWPVLWFTVLVIASLSRLDARHQLEFGPATLAANLLALPPLVPMLLIHPAAWSISFEFAFYAMFILYAILRRALPPPVSLAIVASVSLVLLSQGQNVRGIGFLLGLAVVYWPRSHWPVAILRHCGLFLLSGMIVWHWVFLVADASKPTPFFDVLVSRGDAASAFAAGAALVWLGLKGAFLGHGAFARLLERPTCQWLGTVSFSLYLWSPIVMAPIKKLIVLAHLPALIGPWSQLAFLALSVLPLLWVSALSQRWLEDGLTRWIRRRLARAPRGEAP